MERNFNKCKYNETLLLPCNELLIIAHTWAVDNNIKGCDVDNYIKAKDLKECPYCNITFMKGE